MKIEYTTSLILGLKAGNKSSVSLWYSSTAPLLHSFFRSKVKVEIDADELTHDTLLSCLSSLPLYRGDAEFFSWMMGIARHELADYYRKQYAKRVIVVIPMGEQLLEATLNETRDISDLVENVLSSLPSTVGELLQLKYIDKMSVEKISRKLKLEPHAVQGKLYRARKAFRRMYKSIQDEENVEFQNE